MRRSPRLHGNRSQSRSGMCTRVVVGVCATFASLAACALAQARSQDDAPSPAQAASQGLSSEQAKAIDAASLLRDTEAAVHLAGGLQVQSDRATARDGEPLVFTLELPRAGYLNVISIDAAGAPTVLFPNKQHPDNRVEAGRFTLPGAGMSFEVRAGAPYGRTTVAAFLTHDRMNLFTDDGKRDGTAASASAATDGGVLARLSSTGRGLIDLFGTRSLSADPKSPPMLAGLTTVQTCAAKGRCEADAPTSPSRFLQVLGALAPGILSEPEAKSPVLPAPVREMSAKGLLLTKVSEGFVPQLYEDAAHYCSIAYGHLLHMSRCGRDDRRVYPGRLPEPAGAQLLLKDMARAERAVMQLVTVQLTDSQFAALCDFTYNVGGANLRRSTLLKVVNTGDHARVPSQMRRWSQAGGVTLRGLQTRREREIVLFFDGKPVPKALVEDPDSTPVDIQSGEAGS